LYLEDGLSLTGEIDSVGDDDAVLGTGIVLDFVELKFDPFA